MRLGAAWIALAALPLAADAAAQTVTRIIADTDPARSLGTQVTASGTIHDIDGGTRAGANLFHSFTRFDLGAGDTARWVHGAGDPTGIANVINRVTGGTPSLIEGRIDSTALPNADFWFINPSGILFGAGARLDVPAAAHFSTAAALRFADGTAFAVTTPGGSTFSVAAPAAFGFDGGQGDISVDGVEAFLPAASALTLAGRNVRVSGSSFSGAGLLFLAVGAGPREIDPGDSVSPGLGGELLVENSAVRLARGPVAPAGIRLAGGEVRLDFADIGAPFTDDGLSSGGPIRIAGSEIDIFASLISSSSFGAENSGDIAIAAGSVRIDGGSILTTDLEAGSTGRAGNLSIDADRLVVIGSRITSSTQTDRPGGAIALAADTIFLSDGTVVAASGLSASTSDAGSIRITGRVLDVGPAASIASSVDGSGAAGSIEIDMSERIVLTRSSVSSSSDGPSSGSAGAVLIRSGALEMRDFSEISTATSGIGNAGLVVIDVDEALVDGESRIVSIANPQSSGNAGIVTLFADRLRLGGGAEISSDTFGPGSGGGVLVQGIDLLLADNARISSDSLSFCFPDSCPPAGNAGGVAIIADRLRLADFDETDGVVIISSDTRNGGNAGLIGLLVGSLEMDGEGALIASDTFGSGRGGAILIEAGEVALRNGARLSTGAFAEGAGGTIAIEAGSILLESEAAIMAQSSFGDSGRGGSVRIRTGDLVMRNVAEINTNSRGSGQAGIVDIVARRIDMDRSFIGSDSFGAGDGGAVSLDAEEISIRSGGLVSSDALGFCGGVDCDRPGDAGSVTVKAQRLTLAGSESELGPEFSGITSQSFGDGHAGNVVVTAEALVMDLARIASGTEGDGDAGTVTVDTGRLEMTAGAQISTGSTPFCSDICPAGGDAGAVIITARDTVSLSGDSAISSGTTAGGAGGTLRIETGILSVEESTIESATQGSGDAGEIEIRADEVRLGFLGRIQSGADGNSTGNAGSVSIEARDIALDSGEIGSSGNGFGSAGTVKITAESLRLDRRSVIATIAGLDASANGSIDIEAGFVRVDNGSLITSSSTSSAEVGGAVRIAADRFEMGTLTQITSSTFGAGAGGSVTITAGEAELGQGAEIASRAEEGSTGAGGFVSLTADRLAMFRAGLSSETFGYGGAGLVFVEAVSVELDQSTISSSARSDFGASGAIAIGAERLRLANGSMVRTDSANPNAAGGIGILAEEMIVEGSSDVSSANQSPAGGAAGTVFLGVGALTLTEGGSLSTSSLAGAAGNIVIATPEDAIIRLGGEGLPGIVTTSSGPGTGGLIIIANPYAIISDGGSILALGEQGGANVQIQTDFFISSADRPNRVAVDGNFLLEAQVGDMSRGTVDRDLSVLDASGVLRGQCAAVRSTGQVSLLVVRPIGPLAAPGGGDSRSTDSGSCS